MTAQSARYHIVIPVFNRREITLDCLRQLQPLSAKSDWRIHVIDDGSTDGTSSAIKNEFPEVNLLQGDGRLFWTGAIELGMRQAVKEGAECCIWCNDDVEFLPGSIEKVATAAIRHDCIVAGQGMIDRGDRGMWYFPGLFRGKSSLEFKDFPVGSDVPFPVDTVRGNLVAVPKSCIEKIGFPDGKNIPHIGGDSDYGLRATRAGIPCLTLTSAGFFEKENIRDDNRSWLLGNRPALKILKATLSKRGNLYPRMTLVYNIRHWKFRGAFNILSGYSRLLVTCLLKSTVPKSVLLRLFAHRSHAFKVYEGSPGETGG